MVAIYRPVSDIMKLKSSFCFFSSIIAAFTGPLIYPFSDIFYNLRDDTKDWGFVSFCFRRLNENAKVVPEPYLDFTPILP